MTLNIAVYDHVLEDLLSQSASRHTHLCPRQVLGVRMALYAGDLLGLNLPQSNKRLFTFVETDGCFVDGIEVGTGCSPGHRTLRLIDYGKVAATFVDVPTCQAIRIAPSPLSRQKARLLNPQAKSRWHAQLMAYKDLPYDQLFIVQQVRLALDLQAIISRAGVRVNCDRCGEEIINEREVQIDNKNLCRACADGAYYQVRNKI